MSERQIQVLFIDASTGKAFGQALVPAERLPETFERPTTLTISGQDWSVIKAEPQRAEDILQTGKLALTLAKITRMNPKDILYSLPTICDTIPAIAPGTTRQGKNTFEIHEDDWRQIEWISTAYRSAIETQLTEIRHIYDEASVDTGSFWAFKNIFIRSQIPSPISSQIPLSQLVSLLPEHRPYDGISYLNEVELIAGGFAFGLAGLIVYGQAANGLAQTLALHAGPGAIENASEIASAFSAIMRAYDLYLVDWCAVTVLSPDTAAIQRYLQAS